MKERRPTREDDDEEESCSSRRVNVRGEVDMVRRRERVGRRDRTLLKTREGGRITFGERVGERGRRKEDVELTSRCLGFFSTFIRLPPHSTLSLYR